MSISNNTTKLQSLMDKINALPEAENLDEEVSTQETLISEQDTKIAELAEILNNKASVSYPILSNQGTSADLLAGKQLIAQDGTIITGTIETVTQATPSITIDSTTGNITASSIQNGGYIIGGTKSATKQLAIKSAATYTPNTSNQTIASGRYLTGIQTIKGDSNLVAGNIKSGVSIFGVNGSYVGTEAENLDEELATQDTLITSIQSKLDGDVSGNSSGVKTCTLTIEYDQIDYIDYVGITNGNIAYKTHATSIDGNQITDILANSIFIARSNNKTIDGLKGDNNFDYRNTISSSSYVYFICMTYGDCTITDSGEGLEDW